MLTNHEISKVEAVILVLMINFIIASIYLIFKLIRKDMSCGIMMSVFMILCPLVGPLYLFFSWLVYGMYFKRRKRHLSIEDLSMRKERIELIVKPDMSSALDKVPLEEALLVSDRKSTRKMLLDLLREDNSDSLKTILKAVEHADSEVSHYAASAISDIINDFKIREKELRKRYNEDKMNCKLCNEYIDYLNNFLSQKVLPTDEQRFYCSKFEELVAIVEENLPSEISGELYNKLICILLGLGENDKAKAWVIKTLINYENDLGSYKAGLRYFYMNKNRHEFLLLLEKLKKSDVLLDHEILDMVRFFSY